MNIQADTSFEECQIFLGFKPIYFMLSEFVLIHTYYLLSQKEQMEHFRKKNNENMVTCPGQIMKFWKNRTLDQVCQQSDKPSG